MDEDWRYTSEFLCNPWGQGQRGVASKGPKSILYKHSHVAYQIEGNEEYNTVVQTILPQGHVWGSPEVKK